MLNCSIYAQDIFKTIADIIIKDDTGWKSLILLTVLSIALIIYIFSKLSIKIPFPSITFNNKAKNLEMDETINTLRKDIHKFKHDLVVYINYTDIIRNKITSIKNNYKTEINRDIGTVLLKTLTYIEDWFKSEIINNSDMRSDRCHYCKVTSFNSIQDLLEYNFKEEITTAIEKNGFLDLTGNEFNNYIENLKFAFRDIIKNNILKHYIDPTDFDKIFNSTKTDKEYSLMLVNVNNVLHDLFSAIQTKENKMFNEVSELTTDYKDKMKTNVIASNDMIINPIDDLIPKIEK